MKTILTLSFWLFALVSLAQLPTMSPASRVYRLNDNLIIADSLGNAATVYPYSQVTVRGVTNAIEIIIAGQYRQFSPEKFLNANGVAYSTASVSAALSNYLLSFSASIGGGGSATTDASLLTSGTLGVARLPGSVLLSTGSYSNPTWISALDPNRVTQNSTNRFVTDAEKTNWNNAVTAANTHTGQIASLSANTGTYQSEVSAYAAMHQAVGSLPDARSLGSLDRLVVGMKKAGLWTKVKDFMPILGSNLAGAILKVVGPQSATAVGFAETDFTLAGGLDSGTGNTTNAGKYVDLGVDATTLGVSYNNISLLVGLAAGGVGARTGNSSLGFGQLIGNFDVAAAASIAFLNANGNSSVGGISLAYPLSIISAVSSTSLGVAFFRNGIQQSVATAATSTSPITGNFNLFRGRLSSTTFYNTERIGISLICAGLTDVEAKALQNIVLTYLREIGRIPSKPFLMGFGDSITAGTGATNLTNTSWTSVLSKKMGYNNLNLGIGSTQFRQTATIYPGGFGRYADTYTLPSDLTAIMYGTNDIGADVNTAGDATIISDLGSKLNTMLGDFQLRGNRVVVVSPPWRSTATANDTKMSAYILAQANVAVSQNVPFVDAYNIFLDTGVSSIQTSFFPDNLHPNDAGHKLIADHALAATQGRLYRDALLDFPSIAAGASASLTVTMYTARAGQGVTVTLPASLSSLGLNLTYWISGNDTVTVQLVNPTGAAIDPPSSNYKTTLFLN